MCVEAVEGVCGGGGVGADVIKIMDFPTQPWRDTTVRSIRIGFCSSDNIISELCRIPLLNILRD